MPFFPAPPPAGLAEAVSRELRGELPLWAARPRRSALARPVWQPVIESLFFILVFAFLGLMAILSLRNKDYSEFTMYVVAFYVMAVVRPLSRVIKQMLPGQSRYMDRYLIAQRRAAILENFFFMALAYTIVVAGTNQKLSNPVIEAIIVFFFLAASLRPLAALIRLLRTDQAYYIITERRAIIFENYYGNPRVRSFEPGSIRGCERVFRKGTTGDLLFQRTTERTPTSDHDTEVGFFGLESVAEAEAALRRMLKAQSQALSQPKPKPGQPGA